MTRLLFILLLLAIVARGDETNQPPANSFEAFKVIAQRNIFDASRSAPGVRREPREERKPVRVDYLNLLGAMSYEKGAFAFFDGSNSEYRKTVKTGESIAGCKVAEVTQTNVTLEISGKTLTLEVGSQLKRQDDGEWQVNATVESFSSSGAASSSTPATSASSTNSTSTSNSSGSSEGPSEALKRLLERRRQEK